MMAHDIGSAKFDPFEDEGWCAEVKLDGYRAQLHIHPGGNELWSRTGHNLIEQVPWLRELKAGVDSVLDGELVAENGGGSHDVNHLLAQKDGLSFAAFDLLVLDGVLLVDQPFVERCKALNRAVMKLEMELEAVGRLYVLRLEVKDKRGLYDFVVGRGGEGVMLKRLDSLYRPGVRSWDWLKAKKTETFDVIVTDCDAQPTRWTVRPGQVGTDGVFYPEGKPSSTWQAGFVGLSYGYWDSVAQKPYRVGSLGVTGPREEMERFVGKVVEVKGWGRYRTGAIRHPQMVRVREDKHREECVL
jgi:bifunctional non-homologous end joining protein LigD